MKVELNYSEQDAIKLFEAQGLSVEQDTIVGKEIGHGQSFPDTTQMVVVNPYTKERVLLSNAMQRLFQHKILSDMYYYDKMAVLDALNCQAVKDPFNKIISKSESTN